MSDRTGWARVCYKLGMRESGPLSLSLSFAGLDAERLGVGPSGAGRAGDASAGARVVEGLIERAAERGFGAVHIDGTMPGVRARDLDRSARRGLAAMLRRSELVCSGLDVFIPPEHFADAGRVDRAVSAVTGAIGLCADLAGLSAGAVVSRAPARFVSVGVALAPETPVDVVAALGAAAVQRGVRLADYAWPERAASAGGEAVGVGIDPAAMIAAGADPVRGAAGVGARLACARLSDAASGSRTRSAPGSRGGSLNLIEYRIALQGAGYAAPVVLDLRGVGNQGAAMEAAREAWRRADPFAAAVGRV